VANSYVVRLKCPYGDHESRRLLEDRQETLIQILATPWDFECPIHGAQRALPLEAKEQHKSSRHPATRHAATQTRYLALALKFLALASGVVLSVVALWGIVLFIHDSRQLQSAKIGQRTDVVAANAVASTQELAEPWSSKTFVFHGAKENIASIVVRLPEGAPDQPVSYWAFSRKQLIGNCELEYITDLQRLSSDYNLQANHPMVVDPCSRAVFDPLQRADLPGGAWARGAVVKGYAFRAPLAIEIHMNSDQLVAVKME